MCPSKGFNWFETSFRKYCILHLNPTKANQDLQFWMCVTIWISIYVSACPSFYTSISLYLARNLSVCRSVYSSWNVEILPAGATQTKQTPNIHQYTSVFRSVPIPIASLHENVSPLSPHWHPKKSDVSTFSLSPKKRSKGPYLSQIRAPPSWPHSQKLQLIWSSRFVSRPVLVDWSHLSTMGPRRGFLPVDLKIFEVPKEGMVNYGEAVPEVGWSTSRFFMLGL